MTGLACPCCGGAITPGVLPAEELAERVGCGNTFLMIVECLARRPGHVVRHDAMIDYVYGMREDGGPEYARETIKVMICRFRHRLPQFGWKIETVWGVGYRLAVHPAFRGG